MKKLITVVLFILTSIAIPMLTDSGKNFIFGFAKEYLTPALLYWREVLIVALAVWVIALLARNSKPTTPYKMRFEQLWDKEGTLFCKTCKTPVDRDLDALWCPHCKKEVELFDGRRKITLYEARMRLK
ncbi:hypothetical protein ABKV78_01350 [Enterobacter asburiae]|uniref:hypothetical protein n=1 Tax=Enterobacter cloacae complex TaxID=354276 RepID=UPI0018C2F79C|nr:hypothetical protein [Enterobacter roggenkampii]MBG0660378.1 hypothetical protein [Enterobacter roggenkampii]